MRAVTCAVVAAAIALVALGVCDRQDSQDAQIAPGSDATAGEGASLARGPGEPPNGGTPARAKRNAGVGAEPSAARAELCIVVRNEQRSLLIGAQVHVVVEDDGVFDARTDAQGEAILFLPAGRAVASVRCEGYSPGELRLEVTDAGRETRSITLTPGITVDVRVVRDDDGTPVAGARVAVRLGVLGGSGEPQDHGAAIDAGWTGADGTQRLAGADPRQPQTIMAVAPGFVRVVEWIRPNDVARTSVEIRLAAGGSLTGRVVDSAGVPAIATLWLYVAGTAGAAGAETIDLTYCGDDGTFEFDHLPLDGLFDIEAIARKYEVHSAGRPRMSVRAVRPSAVPVGDSLLMRLPPPATVRLVLEGHNGEDAALVDGSDGEDVGPSVSLLPRVSASAEPDAAGVTEVQLGESVRIRSGYWRAIVEPTEHHPGGNTDFEVAPGAAVVVSIPRRETYPLRGRVVDRAGRGIADVRVEAERVPFGERVVMVSGTDGTFAEPYLGRGTWELSVTTHRGVAAPVIVEMPPSDAPPPAAASARSDPPPVTITVAEGAMFVVRFPEVARQQRMHVRFDRRRPPGALDDDGETPDGWGGEGYESGVCHKPATWGPCAPGAWRVVARVVGFRPWVREFTVTDGTTQVVDIDGLDPGVAITGTVVDTRGAPLAGVSVRLLDGWWDSTGQETRADGVFTPIASPPGPALLELTAHGYPTTHVGIDATPGLAPLRLVLHRGGVAAIEVRRADGTRAPGVPVLATDADGTEMNRWHGEVPTTDERGIYRLNAPPGKYRVRIGDAVTMDVEIKDEATTTWTATVR